MLTPILIRNEDPRNFSAETAQEVIGALRNLLQSAEEDLAHLRETEKEALGLRTTVQSLMETVENLKAAQKAAAERIHEVREAWIAERIAHAETVGFLRAVHPTRA